MPNFWVTDTNTVTDKLIKFPTFASFSFMTFCVLFCNYRMLIKTHIKTDVGSQQEPDPQS